MWRRHEALRSWLNESQGQRQLSTTCTSLADCGDADIDSPSLDSAEQPGRPWRGSDHAPATSESQQPFEEHAFERQSPIRVLSRQCASFSVESSLKLAEESPSCTSSASTVSASSDTDLCGQHPVSVQPPSSAPPSCLRIDRSSSFARSASSSLHSVGSAPVWQRRMASLGDSEQARDHLDSALQAFKMATDSITSDGTTNNSTSDGSSHAKQARHSALGPSS